MSFTQAREFVRGLGLSSASEFIAYIAGRIPGKPARPTTLPSNPNIKYAAAGWTSWPDFLGNKYRPCMRKGAARPFEAAREFARSLGLKSIDEWRLRYRFGLMKDKPPRPADIPSCPDLTYRLKGWAGWPDFLGITQRGSICVPKMFRSFEEARMYARGLGLCSSNAWYESFEAGKAQRPIDVPYDPDQAYAGRGWTSWEDFLGFGLNRYGEPFRSHSDARLFAHNLGLANRAAWKRYCTKANVDGSLPRDIPVNPSLVYRRSGWSGWRDFLGIRAHTPVPRWRKFVGARAFARTLGCAYDLTSSREWRALRRSNPELFPSDIPANPDDIYYVNWTNWADFLGATPVKLPGQWQRRAARLGFDPQQLTLAPFGTAAAQSA